VEPTKGLLLVVEECETNGGKKVICSGMAGKLASSEFRHAGFWQ